MLKEERQSFIMREINLHNKVLSSDLSVQLNVSEDTIRRDLNELAEHGKLQKVYGGALSKSFQYSSDSTDVYARDAKKELARKAAKLIQPGMVILAGGGTTMIEVARTLPESLKCTIFTVSPLVALELSEHKNIEVIIIGGQLSKSSHVNTGAMTISILNDIKTDLCLLGTNGLSPEDGLTDSDWEVVQLKKAMIRSAKRTAVLSIAEKLGSSQKMKVCGINSLRYLITELPADDPQLEEYRQVISVL